MRQHAVSLIAVFLALGLGVVLGSGLLSNSLVAGLRDDKDDMGRELQAEHDRANRLDSELRATDDYDATVAPRVVRDELVDRTVLVVTTPDTDPADLDAVMRTVASAGGTVSGRLSLTESFLDAAGADMLRTTVTNIIPAGVQLQTAPSIRAASRATCSARYCSSIPRPVCLAAPRRNANSHCPRCAAVDSSPTTEPSSLPSPP